LVSRLTKGSLGYGFEFGYDAKIPVVPLAPITSDPVPFQNFRNANGQQLFGAVNRTAAATPRQLVFTGCQGPRSLIDKLLDHVQPIAEAMAIQDIYDSASQFLLDLWFE
jgi:hypothetical protein